METFVPTSKDCNTTDCCKYCGFGIDAERTIIIIIIIIEMKEWVNALATLCIFWTHRIQIANMKYRVHHSNEHEWQMNRGHYSIYSLQMYMGCLDQNIYMLNAAKVAHNYQKIYSYQHTDTTTSSMSA